MASSHMTARWACTIPCDVLAISHRQERLFGHINWWSGPMTGDVV